MALFGKKDETEKKVVSKSKKETKTSSSATGVTRDLSSVILRPHVTEKAALGTDRNVYTFEISRDANKYDVKNAIISLYKVTPIKINVVNKKPRHYMSKMKGRKMTEHGMKKAYVYLKKGDRIDLV